MFYWLAGDDEVASPYYLYFIIFQACFIVVGYWTLVLPYSVETWPGLAVSVLWNLGCCYVFLGIRKIVQTSPGTVPDGWKPPGVSDEQLEAERKENQTLRQRTLKSYTYCTLCKSWRPRRAHHSVVLGKCVLRMDHYCHWVWNCIGYYNHKVFNNSIWAASLCMLHFWCQVCLRIYYSLSYFHEPSTRIPITALELFFCAVHLIETGGVALGVCTMGVYQMYYVLKNRTSIEGFIIRRHEVAFNDIGIPFQWAFDYGTAKNLRDFYGNGSWWDWINLEIPENKKTGNPFEWKTNALPKEVITLLEKQEYKKNL